MTTRRKPIGIINNFGGGQNSVAPPDTLELVEGEEVQNVVILPRGRGIRTMNGDTAFNSSAMNSGATVTGLLYYKQADGDDWLVATAGDKIFKSDSLDGTMDDISAALTITAGDNNIWTSFVAEDEAVFVGGAPDAPIKFTGTGNAVVLGGSPPSGNFGFYHNNRAFIGNTTANPSRLNWSVLGDIDDWSGDGSGFQSVQTNDGDTLIGAGIITTDLVLLFKENSIHQLVTHTAPFPVFELFPNVGAVAKTAIVQGPNGLIWFITSDGRMLATDGSRVLGEETFPRLKNIEDVWDGFNQARLDQIRLSHYRGKDFNWIIATAPNGTATQNDYGVFWDLDNQCWGTLPDGFSTNIFATTQAGVLYGGHFDGVIYKKDVTSTTTNASEASAIVEGNWRSGWYGFGNVQSLKYQEEILVVAKTETSGKMNISVGKDFSKDVFNADLSLISPGGKYGSAIYGTSKYGGRNDFISEPILIHVRGRVIQYKFDNTGQANAFTLNNYSPIGSVSD